MAGLLGMSVEELMEKRGKQALILDAIHPDDRAYYQEVLKAADNALETYDVEYRVQDTAGALRYWREMGEPELDGSGRLVRTFGTVQDVTNIKQVDEALRQSEDQLRQATELAGLGYSIWDSIEDRCLHCSAEFARIHGTSVEDYMAGRAAIDGEWTFTHPDDRDAYRAAIRKLRSQGTGFDMEYRVVTPGGETRYVQETVKPVFDDSGQVIQEYLTIQDVTGQKHVEEAVRTRDAWLGAILENAPIQIVLKDTEGRVMAISENLLDDRDTPAEEYLGCTVADFLPADIAQVYMALDRKVLETGQSVQQEVVEEFNGSTRYCLSAKFPLTDDSDRIIGICSLTTDITEMKLAEEQLRQAQKIDAIGKLAGGIAHDFNNLLSVIQVNLVLLKRKVETSKETEEIIDSIKTAATLATDLTRSLLAFSRRQPHTPMAIDLGKLITGTAKSLLRTLQADIEVETSFADDLRPVLMDPYQLENLILNLALNARDAMPEGGRLEVEASNLEMDRSTMEAASLPSDGKYVKLVVSDNGVGMPDDVIEQAFDPFFTTKEVGEGTGLGLSMIYGVIKQSGGHIELESKVGKGTRVTMYLPCADEATDRPVQAPDRSEEPVRGGSETILVTEDDEAMRKATVKVLGELGYRTIEAADADQALEILGEYPSIDLLFSDVVLPGSMTGYQLAKRTRDRFPGLKVLFGSGYFALPGSSAEIQIPAHLLVHKPYDPDELGRRIREALDGSPGT
jgi:PAS domain S-box-containing protein